LEVAIYSRKAQRRITASSDNDTAFLEIFIDDEKSSIKAIVSVFTDVN